MTIPSEIIKSVEKEDESCKRNIAGNLELLNGVSVKENEWSCKKSTLWMVKEQWPRKQRQHCVLKQQMAMC